MLGFKIVIITATFFSLWYAIAILILRGGLKRIGREKSGLPQNHSFSIVIAARNEEKNIGACLESIVRQTVSVDRYEIIVVDDRSEDRTAEIVSGYMRGGAPVKLLSIKELPPGVVPKKNAISKGIECAVNEIIVFTDADCIVGSSWLETIDKYFYGTIGILQGITTYFKVSELNPLFFGLQAADFLSHGVVAASGIGAGIPINSNANNLAIRKNVFFEVGGYTRGLERIVSADDDLLLQKVWRSKEWRVAFMADTAGAVTTKPTISVSGVFNQRKRWGSNTAHYNYLQIMFLSGIFLFYLNIALLFFLSVFSLNYLFILLILLGIKIAGEMCMMIPGTALFNRKELRKYLIPASLLQLPVVLGAVIFGTFGTFSWKGQKFHRKLD
jgi:cellulose synthase/poly-beta-1,6-N-acetylglucosamine synthase-like glycosyltransferase